MRRLATAYTRVGDALRLDAGPSNTRQIIDQLNRVAQKARDERLSAEEVLAEIADINPDLAKKLKSIGPWPVVGILIFLFWLVKSVTLDLRVDVNWLIDQAWHLSHGQDPDQHLNTSPPDFPLRPQAPSALRRTPFNQAIVEATSPNRNARRRTTAEANRKQRRKNRGSR
jgi:hypothetical protein